MTKYKKYIFPFIILITGFLFYGKSIQNEYALDDGLVIENNELVHKGVKGIKDILTKDAYTSFYKQYGSSGQLSGGRYRPLSIVTFALEYELMGFKKGDKIHFTTVDGEKIEGKVTKVLNYGGLEYTSSSIPKGIISFKNVDEFKKLANFQHFINVLLYSIGCIVLFYFLSNILFKNLHHYEWLSLFTTLLFLIHPIHSEVVANIKSRDEILSFIFILITLIYFYKILEHKSYNGIIYPMIISMVSFSLAILSKEYAIILVIICPLWAWYYEKKFKLLPILISIVPIIIILIPYFILRLNASVILTDTSIKEDVLNNPYLFATAAQKIATEIYVLLKYLVLLIFPFPLSSDYSYNTIQYRSFISVEVWLSILIHLLIIVGTIYSWIKKQWIFCFSGLLYLLNLALIGNIVFDIGATMGERLIFHGSLGFIIALSYGLYLLLKSNTNYFKISLGLLIIISIPFLYINYERCKAWKSDYTLALTDVKTNPNSALLNANAGAYISNMTDNFEYANKKEQMLDDAKKYILKALEVHPVMVNSWINLSVVELKKKNIVGCIDAYEVADSLFHTHPNLTRLREAMVQYILFETTNWASQNKTNDALYYLNYANKKLSPNNVDLLYNIGGAYFTIEKYDSAVYYFDKTIQLNPNYPQAKEGLNAATIFANKN